ncbi:zf-HC2 domain-containing protein [Streptomyces tailanensis]|uniref:zf-HC2 domain-containing protein n=1 Tax=Streptomyces tailanensis TaxID=2569858 RepID=UPI00122E6222|nr:zf-HC2 domain-containing protein [Streptomyces tailanensis]
MTKLSASRPCRFWAECRERLRHLRLRGAVGAYADGQLTGVRRTRVARHVAHCWTCSGELLVLRLIKASCGERDRHGTGARAVISGISR